MENEKNAQSGVRERRYYTVKNKFDELLIAVCEDMQKEELEAFHAIEVKPVTGPNLKISKKRYKERGYNQSYLIAKEIAKNTDLEILNNCLIKTKNIIEQSKLNKEERKINIQGVYEIKNSALIKNKKILLIDDIYTTGSTVNECSKILNKEKTNKIGVLTIAKD